MRVTKLATFISTVLLGAGVAQAGGGDKITQEQFTAADKDRDGAITMAEATSGLPTLAGKFTSVDTNGDGKVTSDEMNAYSKSGKSMESDEATSPPTDQSSPPTDQ